MNDHDVVENHNVDMLLLDEIVEETSEKGTYYGDSTERRHH
jgi:hypothetical protein